MFYPSCHGKKLVSFLRMAAFLFLKSHAKSFPTISFDEIYKHHFKMCPSKTGGAIHIREFKFICDNFKGIMYVLT